MTEDHTTKPNMDELDPLWATCPKCGELFMARDMEGPFLEETFIRRLEAARRHAGLSRLELTKRAGFGAGYYKLWDNGTIPTAQVVETLAAILQVNADWLVPAQLTRVRWERRRPRRWYAANAQ